MTGVFQAVAVKYLELTMGGGEGGEGGEGARDTERVGAPFPSKTDPGKALEHGHRGGVRRDSAAEESHAESDT